jgi:malonate-semialdehyde dehydrogenase (acetylating)/methylmalonate-semialdehyde dehydrogenase
MPVISRQTVLFNYQQLLRKHHAELAKVITLEQGKTLADAEGDVLRGIQVVEHACGIPTLLQGESLSTLARDLDTVSYRVPLGVVAGVCPCVARSRMECETIRTVPPPPASTSQP